MIYKMEKLDRVVDKLVRDLGLGQDNIPYTDFIEWIADALQHIGAYPQFLEKECAINIEDYEGVLPCDLYKVIRLKKGYPMPENTQGGFYEGTISEQLETAGVDFSELTAYERYKILAVPGISKVKNNIETSLPNASGLFYNGNLINSGAHTDSDYNVNFNKITTAFKTGFIDIQYLSFPVDERGWPLVPDDVSFRDALFWKCAYHISMRDPSQLKNPRMQDMEYCRQQWNRTCVQARAGANMPDMAQIERLKNNWLRLHNSTNDDQEGYKNLGKNHGRINTRY